MEISKIQENIFATIGKTIALALIKREVPSIMKKLDEDPMIVANLDALRYHADKLSELLPDFCKNHPDSNLCNDKKSKGK